MMLFFSPAIALVLLLVLLLWLPLRFLAVPILLIVMFHLVTKKNHHNYHHRHYNWRQSNYRTQPHSANRERKAARDVKVEDDDWSDF
ncbi:hypothetical protein ACX53_00630 [Loigolactobacillus backii]|nr:hypothetical protein ACX53_00630 [Loigolactobacillus backii]